MFLHDKVLGWQAVLVYLDISMIYIYIYVLFLTLVSRSLHLLHMFCFTIH